MLAEEEVSESETEAAAALCDELRGIREALIKRQVVNVAAPVVKVDAPAPAEVVKCWRLTVERRDSDGNIKQVKIEAS